MQERHDAQEALRVARECVFSRQADRIGFTLASQFRRRGPETAAVSALLAVVRATAGACLADDARRTAPQRRDSGLWQEYKVEQPDGYLVAIQARIGHFFNKAIPRQDAEPAYSLTVE